MKPFHTFVLAVSAVSLFACGKKEVELAPLGEGAPAIAQGGDLSSFAVGRWNLLAPGEAVSKTRYYEFKADGSFTTRKTDAEWTAGGKWTLAQNHLQLEYLTMNSKPMAEFKDQIQRESEGGGQPALYRAELYDRLFSQFSSMSSLWVDEDLKHLTFSDPAVTSAMANVQLGDNNIGLDQVMKQTAVKLERMGPKKD